LYFYLNREINGCDNIGTKSHLKVLHHLAKMIKRVTLILTQNIQLLSHSGEKKIASLCLKIYMPS